MKVYGESKYDIPPVLNRPGMMPVQTAFEDANADPEGEFISVVNAASAYRLFGSPGLNTDIMPPTDSPAGQVAMI